MALNATSLPRESVNRLDFKHASLGGRDGLLIGLCLQTTSVRSFFGVGRLALLELNP